METYFEDMCISDYEAERTNGPAFQFNNLGHVWASIPGAPDWETERRAENALRAMAFDDNPSTPATLHKDNKWVSEWLKRASSTHTPKFWLEIDKPERSAQALHIVNGVLPRSNTWGEPSKPTSNESEPLFDSRDSPWHSFPDELFNGLTQAFSHNKVAARELELVERKQLAQEAEGMASGHRVEALSPKSERRLLQAKKRWFDLMSDLARAETRYLKDSKDLQLLKMNASKRVRLLPSVGHTKEKEKTGFVWVAGKARSPDVMDDIFENLKDQDEDAEKKCADEYAKRLKSLIKQRTNMSDIKNELYRARASYTDLLTKQEAVAVFVKSPKSPVPPPSEGSPASQANPNRLDELFLMYAAP